MTIIKLNSYIYQLTTMIMAFTLGYIAWSYDRQIAVFLIGLQVMREISKYTLTKEIERVEENMGKEIDAVLELIKKNKNV